MYSILRATLSPSANTAKCKQSHLIFSCKKYQRAIPLIMLLFARIKGHLQILPGLNKKKRQFFPAILKANKILRRVGYLMCSITMTGNLFSKKNL